MSRHRIIVCFAILLTVLLTSCDTSNDEDSEPLPTRANATELAATAGIIPQENLDATLTARAPSSTPTPDATGTVNAIVTQVVNEIATQTQVALDAITDTPTIKPSPTVTATFTSTATATETLIPSDTPTPTLVSANNPEPNTIIFTSDLTSAADIWVINTDGTGLKSIDGEVGSLDTQPVCDPLGTKLVFVSDRSGDRELYVLNYDEGVVRPLTATVGENYMPAWSPDGELIAFVSSRDGNADIYVMDNGGGNLRRITETEDAVEFHPSWGPDGNSIWYTSNRDGNFDLYRFDLTTGIEAPVTLSPSRNEIEPSLGNTLGTVVYSEETTIGSPETASIFLLDVATGSTEIVAAGDGAITQPRWINDDEILVTADLGEDGTGITRFSLTSDSIEVLTPRGFNHSDPRLCYLPQSFQNSLLDIPQTATPVPSITPDISDTPQPTPTRQANTSVFNPVAEADPLWLVSSETWIDSEMAYIAPRGILPNDVSAFLFDNLVNYTWTDSNGRQHVLSMALEAFRGALEVTTIGYTVDDFPADLAPLIDFDRQLREQILLNSVRLGDYHLEDVQVTDVNVTFVFRVPVLPAEAPPGQYQAISNAPSFNWIISTERWVPTELAQIFGQSLNAEVTSEFVGTSLRFQWIDIGGTHDLVVDLVNVNGNLSVQFFAYAVNNEQQPADAAEQYLYLIRESILLHSLPPGGFQITSIQLVDGTLELVFILPPRFLPEFAPEFDDGAAG